MAHTPGPWHRNIKPASRYPVIFAGRNTHIAAVVQGVRRGTAASTISAEELEANTNLIVAAPDLLEALRQMVTEHPTCSHPIGGEGSPARRQQDRQKAAIAQARAALAKAEAA